MEALKRFQKLVDTMMRDGDKAKDILLDYISWNVNALERFKNKPQAFNDFHDTLAGNTTTALNNIKALKGTLHGYRLRVGDYRLIYQINKNVLTIVIIKIAHRKEIYQ